MNVRNQSGREYLAVSKPLLCNFLFSAAAGATSYLQFIYYNKDQTKIGQYEFSSWTFHIASNFISSSRWGVALPKWIGSSR